MIYMSYVRGFLLCNFLITLLISSTVDASPSKNFQTQLEQTFAAALILMDSDVLAFGIHDFDPNDWFHLENEDIGTDDSIALRNRIQVTTLPYTLDLSNEEAKNRHFLMFRVSGLVSEKNIQLNGQTLEDRSKDRVLAGSVAYKYQYNINDKWAIEPAFSTHLMQYNNKFDYRSDELTQVKDQLDGIYVNTTAWSMIYEPSLAFKYTREKPWGSWGLTSTWHYFYGHGWGDANQGKIGNTEGWYVSNGIRSIYNFDQWGKAVQSMYSSFRRIDLGADIEKPLGTGHYYEASIGWLMTPPFDTEWIENVGLGLNFNYGSALKGGSIVLFFNQS
ncbi:Solitary outer membrane autotransporter beta-barrel domain [Vibrio sp. ZSDE26]|uniref:Solitary outer membrane autotransporter beta-barrel domain n=1 Tax=Vibrio amylolyticus TaxID=2847292 RepID=A0A9X1XIK4_9VIBR|nr:Solitary outer membrane autotransporter beta-barrel domain [Vibrio amylolyticus]MCK6263609.1 Solitary outer membrane autotransporter beta-barrel domain [Vibrio amylolyticus]